MNIGQNIGTTFKRFAATPTALLIVALAACAASIEPRPANAMAPSETWPPPWQELAAPPAADFTPPRFEPPSASHCQRPPSMREVSGMAPGQNAADGRARREYGAAARAAAIAPLEARIALDARADAAADMAKSITAARRETAVTGVSAAAPPAAPQLQPQLQAQLQPQRPAASVVTAGVVDDNADFGEYLAYRQRHAGQPVRERDISERYRLEVTDAHGRPVHDAEVAVQRAGISAPVMWARTDTAGGVWLHPRAFLAPSFEAERVLGVAVRKGGLQARATLLRGQAQALQVRLGATADALTDAAPHAGAGARQRPRLDLVFMVDATGSMGDEIDKLKASMRAMAQQIAQLPGQPDVCFGLVAYRDRGDVFLTRTHDFTNDLGAFQGLLARVHAQGGGDTPEALNEALHEVVHGLSWRVDAARMVVLVADAPPHLDYGGPQYDVDMQAALAKGIKVFAVGASGLDPVGEYIFRQIAQYTAGRFVFLTYKDGANPASGAGTQTGHDVKNYSVQTLDRLVVRLVREEMARLARS